MKKNKNLKINLATNLENISKYIKDDKDIKLHSEIELSAKAYLIIKNDYEPWKMEIIAELEKINDLKTKIEYLKKQNIEYLKSVSSKPEILASSGYTQITHQHKAGLDRWIELEISKIELEMANNYPTKTKNKISYIWGNNPDKELPELFELMINKYKLIAPETTYEQFKAVFTGQPIDENFKPIKWLITKNLNAYFLNQLISLKRIKKMLNKDIWDTAKKCFQDGTNFSQIIEQYKNNKNGLPKNHNIIDELLNELEKT